MNSPLLRVTLGAAVALWTGLTAAVPAQSPGPFLLYPTNTPVLNRTLTSIALADFDGDFNPDAAVLDSAGASSAVRIFRGNGSFGFTPTATVAVGQGPEAIAIGDVDGNNGPDIVVANRLGNSVSVLINDGKGVFTANPPIAVGPRPSDLALGDVNGDSKLDLLVTLWTSDQLAVLLGDGSGKFGTPATHGVDVRPTGLAVGDIDGDDKLDALVVCENLSPSLEGFVGVMRGNGSGGFTKQQSVPVGNGPVEIALVRLDGDTLRDAVVTNSASDTVSVLINAGSAAFRVTDVSVTAGSEPTGIAAADLDRDGKQDVIVTRKRRDDALVLLGDGTGGFAMTPPVTVGLGDEPTAVALDDIDLDGRIDAAFVNVASRGLTYARNDPYRANKIGYILVESGTWARGSFQQSGRIWGTRTPTSGVYVLGVTEPQAGKPFLNAPNLSVDLFADRSYFLFVDPRFGAPGHAVRVTVRWAAMASDAAVFAFACPHFTKVNDLYRHAGSRKLELGRPELDVDRVDYNGLRSNAIRDHVLELRVFTTPKPPKKQPDQVTRVSIQPGTYNYTTRTFAAQGPHWATDTATSSRYVLGITEPLEVKPLLNCTNTIGVTLLPGRFWAYGDGQYQQPRESVQVTVDWASGDRDTATFGVGCAESRPDPQFYRVAGSRAIELGRSGRTALDRVAYNSLATNAIADHVFELVFHEEEPKPRTREDHVVLVAIRGGSFNSTTKQFVPNGSGADTTPGYPGGSYLLMVTDPVADAPRHNCTDAHVSLLSGQYWAYIDSRYYNIGTAVRVELQWAATGNREDAVFEVGDLNKSEPWTRLAGSGNIVLGSTGVVADRIAYNGFGPDNRNDHVLMLSIGAADYVPFGLGCPGSNTLVPAIEKDAVPKIGAPFRIAIRNGKASAPIVVGTGLSRTAFRGLQLPFNLGVLGAPLCTLYVSLDFEVAGVTNQNGEHSFGFSIPDQAAAIGAQFFNQAFILDPAANTLGVALSNAGLGRVGGS